MIEVRFFIDLLAFFSIYLMLSTSLNLEFGYTGIPNFGKVLFFAGGAYVVGAVTSRLVAYIAGIHFTDFPSEHVAVATEATKFLSREPLLAISIFIMMIILGAIVGGVLGYIASYPAIRLREDYLGITLLAFGELVRIIARNYDPLICGTLGVSVPSIFSYIPEPETRELVKIGVMIVIAISSWFFVSKITNSPFGRLLRAIRENEEAARSLGKDIERIRMKTLIVGSAIAGIAGALYAFYTGYVQADDFVPIKTFVVWIMVMIGGPGNNLGAIVGAFTYLFIEKFVMFVKSYIEAPFSIVYLAYITLGIILILILMFKPEGMLPERPIRTIDIRRRRK